MIILRITICYERRWVFDTSYLYFITGFNHSVGNQLMSADDYKYKSAIIVSNPPDTTADCINTSRCDCVNVNLRCTFVPVDFLRK